MKAKKKNKSTGNENKIISKYDWIEGFLLLVVALCLTLPRYFVSIPPFVISAGTGLLCFLPLYYILTYKNYSLWNSDSSTGFPLLMFLWSFLFKCFVLLTFVLSFSEIHWVGNISTRSSMVSVLFIVNRLIMIPYFIVCMYKKAYKEAGIAFVYDLYYQLLGPALTFYVFH